MEVKKIGFLSHLDLNLYLFRLPIMTELLKRGYRVYAICPKGEKNSDLKNAGIEVINYEIERKSINPLKEIYSIKNIYNAIKDLKLDLINTFTAKPNIYGTFASKIAGIPRIINLVEGLGSFYVDNNLKSLLVRNIIEILYKYTFKLSDICIFVNSDDPKYFVDRGIIDSNKVKVIKSVGVDTDYFSMAEVTEDFICMYKEKLSIEKNKIVVLMIGRAIWHKGIREFYEAAEILSNKYHNIDFVFVGDTDEGNPSCAPSSFLKNRNVKWLGFRNDIKYLIAISDIVVLPSYREGVPRTLLEAASMSKPIVTTNTVGCREVVEDGKNGFLVPVKDSIELAKKIEILINDRDLREKMGKYGREKAVKEFDIRRVVDEYISLYEQLLQK
ncbi:MAG: glycosyltransferase family 4 protein [Hydrogenothermaceae bacterium]|nr:glycosyltransferase family 4 protein [Hydrogenothermaceae bacterium]